MLAAGSPITSHQELIVGVVPVHITLVVHVGNLPFGLQPKSLTVNGVIADIARVNKPPAVIHCTGVTI